ncbi:hypothetical protein B0J17DRAFT_771459 [Rhizoctonia solani]|nr:hypothetical protein B0J17DRAFT_771459 [Rhizoctonia solani]
MAFTRSITGCLACKTKRKKCDETKPHCLRCQKSHIECPGYTYIKNPNRPNGMLRTLQAPRTRAGQSRITAHEEPIPQVQDQSPLVTCQTSYSVPSTSAVAQIGTSPEAIDISNRWTFSSSFTGWLQHSSINLNISHGLVVNIMNPNPVLPPPSTSAIPPMTPGQASLLEALFSLGQSPNLGSPFQCAHPRPTTSSNSLPPGTESQNEDENQKNVATVIRREPVLDKTIESNALPFVLQNYAIWVGRTAFEPLKLTEIARDFVLSHFEDGERSRLIIVLLANIGGRSQGEILEGGSNTMHSMLQNAVQCRIGAVKSLDNPERPVLVKTLDSALHTMLLHFFVSQVSDALILRQEAAPIFRQLCPEPPGAPIDLPSLLQHPLRCLGHFVHIDIHLSIATDLPTLFRYEVPIPISQPSNPYRSALTSQNDGVLQWLYGIPDLLILIFAKMKSLRQDGVTPGEETISSLELELCELRPYSGSSSERFLALMRFVVQECWSSLHLSICIWHYVEIHLVHPASNKLSNAI